MLKKTVPIIGILIFTSLFFIIGRNYAGVVDEAIEKGKNYVGRGMYDEAIVEFTRAIDSNPQNADAYYNRGLVYHKKKMMDEAISDYTKAIGNRPGEAEIYFNRGIAYHYNNFPDRAISDWSKAIEISPESADIYQKRAYAYFKRGDYDKSWQDVHRIEELGYNVPSNFLEELKKASGRDR